LTYLDKSLEDLLGDAGEANAAEELVKATQAKIEKTVKDSIVAKRREFEQIGDVERDERLALVTDERLSAYEKRVSCPSCESPCILSGDVVSVSGPRTVEDGTEREVVILPTKLTCHVCELQLNGLPHLYAAHRDLAGQFTDTIFESPEDFYGLDIGPQYDYEEEYDNE